MSRLADNKTNLLSSQSPTSKNQQNREEPLSKISQESKLATLEEEVKSHQQHQAQRRLSQSHSNYEDESDLQVIAREMKNVLETVPDHIQENKRHSAVDNNNNNDENDFVASQGAEDELLSDQNVEIRDKSRGYSKVQYLGVLVIALSLLGQAFALYFYSDVQNQWLNDYELVYNNFSRGGEESQFQQPQDITNLRQQQPTSLFTLLAPEAHTLRKNKRSFMIILPAFYWLSSIGIVGGLPRFTLYMVPLQLLEIYKSYLSAPKMSSFLEPQEVQEFTTGENDFMRLTLLNEVAILFGLVFVYWLNIK